MEHHFCQSCGMPMTSELFGTEKDGGNNRDYLFTAMKTEYIHIQMRH
ncbi:zinc ribbon domain-containing protein [Bacillus haynesii]|nr:zinc ribbon domain-containing protein [Bacillus haynesii]